MGILNIKMTIREKHFQAVEDFYATGLSIMEGKNDDYAKASDPYSNFRFAGQAAGISPAQVMLALIGVKLARIENIIHAPTVNNESLEDSIVDAINYIGILGAYEKLKNAKADDYAYSSDVNGDEFGEEAPLEVYVEEADAENPAPSPNPVNKLLNFLGYSKTPKV